VNGSKVISDLDILRDAGAYRRVLTRTLSVTVSDGHLELSFMPTVGEAVVSTVSVAKQ
jgi:hypothetical protein